MCINYEKMHYSTIKKIFFFIVISLSIFLLVWNSLNKYNKNILGVWGINEISYLGNEISYDTKSTFISMGNIDISSFSNHIYFNLPDFNKTITAEYKAYIQNKKDYINIFNSEDKRLEGIYLIGIKRTIGTSTSRRQSFEMTLTSEKTKIICSKSYYEIL